MTATCAVRLLRSCSLPPARQRRWHRSIPATAAARAPTARARASTESQQSGPGVLSLLPRRRRHRAQHRRQTGKLAYTATAGTFPLFDQSGARSAQIFYTAYVAEDRPIRRTRPVTFVFNGGPGAASAFLNLGLVGPRIAEFGTNGRDGSHVRLVDNPDTWLAFTDLVLIDPVGTGWSRAAKPDGGRAFWSVHGDAESMAKVIALYVAKNSRASSPKFILGESYGGFRAAKVARALQNDQGIVVSGIPDAVAAARGRISNSAATALRSAPRCNCRRSPPPSSSARDAFSKDALAQAEHFALTDYLTTLAGPPLQGDAAKSFYARVAKITGLSVDAITQSRGFIRDDYVKNLAPATTRSSATMTRPLPRTIPIRNRRRRAARIRSSTAWSAPMAAPLSAMRATSSASRPR